MQLMVRQGMVPMMNPAKQIRLVIPADKNRKPNSNSSLKEALVAGKKYGILMLVVGMKNFLRGGGGVDLD